MSRFFRDVRYRIFYGMLLCRKYPLMELGNRSTGCSWRFCPEGLSSESIIYSGGVGRDVTFEHGLVQRFGCSVVMFDPSPTGLETMSLPENRIPQFKFHPVALAGQCGVLNLAPPLNAAEGSWFAPAGGQGTVEVRCADLSTLISENNHDHVDLLKIDIEGAEYGVLDDLLKRRLPVRQIAVEFHHSNLPGIRRTQTVRAMLKLVAAGYKLLEQDGTNHTFFRPDSGAAAERRRRVPKAR